MRKNNPENNGNRRTLCTPMPESKERNIPKFPCTNLSTSFSQRASTSVSEFLQPQTLPRKKKYPVSRQSCLPSQLALEAIKEAEARSKDEELTLLYNDYLQTIMLEHVTKKKSEEVKNTLIKQLTTIAKQCAQDEGKLQKLKIRKRDVMSLTMVQEELDTHINEINGYFGNNKINTTQEVMSHLCSVLEPLDQLRCNNVILPETKEEWVELRKVFEECEHTLGRIKELIDTDAETYQAVHEGIKDLVTVYNEIESCKEKFDKALFDLQVLTLKYGAFSVK